MLSKKQIETGRALFGPELWEQIVGDAEEATKKLEGEGIAYKTRAASRTKGEVPAGILVSQAKADQDTVDAVLAELQPVIDELAGRVADLEARVSGAEEKSLKGAPASFYTKPTPPAVKTADHPAAVYFINGKRQDTTASKFFGGPKR